MSTEKSDGIDLRLLPIAAALWGGALGGLALWWWFGVVLAVTILAGALARRVVGERSRLVILAVLLCALAGFGVGMARSLPVQSGPVAELAADSAHVTVAGVVTRDPAPHGGESVSGRGSDERGYVVTRMRVEQITGRAQTHDVRIPVLVVADTSWLDLRPGQTIRARGRLESADGDVSAVLRADGSPTSLGNPGIASILTEPFRQGLRDSVAGVSADARGLIPGLVVGDETLMPNDLREDMLSTGLSHLTAVSGTNVTIVLVLVMGAARWLGVRGYALGIIGCLAIVGFVFLARADPSVLRAATMGVIAVVGLTSAGARHGPRALAAAVVILLLIDPWLARSVGFTLSVLATAGILLFVPLWEKSLSWLPRPLAVAVAVPLAAQVACTPVLVAISGELSLSALPANVLAAPAVAPITIIGALIAVIAPLWPEFTALLGWLAGFPAGWIAVVARWFADQPGGSVSWGASAAGLVVTVVLAVVVAAAMPAVLRRPFVALSAATLLVIALLRAPPTPGWPPPDWRIVACDVGQADAFVLNVGQGSAVVVDAGREPRAVRQCLDSLDVHHVPLLVLTHFDADHVMGLPGVLAGREVGRAVLSPVDEPTGGARSVRRWLGEADTPVETARAGQEYQVADLHARVLWPRRLLETSEESAANNASVVMAANIGGTTALLTGDIEPSAQRALLRAEPNLEVDVLKVAHHGSPHQESELLMDVGARVALIGVGENSYGHPAPHVLSTLKRAGVATYRTDADGSIAIVRGEDGTLGVVTKK